MFLVDSHCHPDALDYHALHQDFDDVLNKAAARDVKFMLAVATTLSGYQAMKSLTGKRDCVAYSCGVHPLNLDEGFELAELRQLAAEPQVVAIGETGLDYHYQQQSKIHQQNAFRQHIRLGCELNKPVIVHTREAREDTLAVLREEQAEICGGVLHCFTEDRATATKLLDMGFYISFSGIITFRNAEALREVARFVPLERMLVETDSPWLAPVPWRGKENQPAYTRDIAEYLAQLKQVDMQTLAAATTKNFAKLFHISLSQLNIMD